MSVEELGKLYSAEWFAHDFEHLQPEFDVVADAIYREFYPKVAIDVGCGPGMVLGRLVGHGVACKGYEGSAHGIAYARPELRDAIEHVDITALTSLPMMGEHGVVICTEVAEHLDEKHAEGLVRLLCSSMSPIVFTAAPPGQDGHHHVNCREEGYWLDFFEMCGASYCHESTQRMKWRWGWLKRLSHMARNVMVFR